MNDPPPPMELSERELGQTSGLDDRSFRFYQYAIKWLGMVAIAAIAGVVVMALCDQGMVASSLVAVATAAVAGMAAVFK